MFYRVVSTTQKDIQIKRKESDRNEYPRNTQGDKKTCNYMH